MQGDLIVVFGGSGFIGRQVVRALIKRGKRVRIAMRRPHLGHELRVMGDVGQVQLVQANVRFPDSVDRALEDADGVVNCVGLLFEKGAQTFRGVQVDGAGSIAEAAAKHAIKRVVHVSAIGADEKSPARYGRAKAEAERLMRAAVPDTVILRPSIVFGAEDNFLNRFANMAKFAPVMPALGGGKTMMAPVYVGDVAEAVANALDLPQAQGRTYELGGPRTYSFKQLLSYVLTETDRPRPLLPLPFFVAQPLGLLMDWGFRLYPFASPPLTGDQVAMLKRDSTPASDAPGLADLGVTTLESIESVAPSYLWKFRPYGQFQARQA